MHHPTRSGPGERRSPARRIAFLGALLAALVPAAPRPVAAQAGEVAGTVVDAQARPVVGAQVSVQGQSRALTDAGGRFRITGLRGSQVTLAVQRVGYSRATA